MNDNGPVTGGTVRRRTKRVEMSLKHDFYSDHFHISPTDRGHVADVSQ